jgi:DNA-binding beta-propeller fold protein YncE
MKVRKLTHSVLAALTATLAAFALGASTAAAFKAHTQVLESASFSQPGIFEKPTGVAVDQQTGNVYVADSKANIIDVFGAEGGSPAGGVPAQITGFSFGGEPAAVAVDNACFFQHKSGAACESFDPSNEDVYVAEATEHAIAKFKLNTAKHEYEPAGTLIVAEPFEPNGVAVDTEGNVYVANFDANAITEFNASGVIVGNIEQNTVSGPGYVAVGAPGVVYVGSYEGAFGGGVAKLEVNSKDEVTHQEKLNAEGRAVAVDSQGDVFVADASYISEYNPSGSLREEFGSGLVGGPLKGVAVNDSIEYMYVSSEQTGDVFAFAPLITLPEVVTGGASAVLSTSATVNGEVNPEGLEATSFFEYGPCSAPSSCALSAFGQTQATVPPGDGSGGVYVQVQAPLSGLEPNETYHYRLVAHDEHGDHAGEAQTFATAPLPPALKARPAAFVTSATALLSATINPENAITAYHFEYGPCATPATCAGSGYPATTSTGESAVYEDVGISSELSGLQAATAYHYRLLATNEHDETTEGPEGTFTTAVLPAPTVVTGAASGISQTAAAISGTVDPNGVPTTYRFELGAGAADATVAFGDAGSESAVVTVATGLSGLQPGTAYNYRLLAINAYGTVAGAEATFTTPGFPAAIVQPATPLLVPTSPFPNVEGGAGSSTKQAQLTCREKAQKIKNAKKRRQALKRCSKHKPRKKGRKQ